MKYQGSKSRIAKYIVPIIQECIDDNGITEYIEPFCGGANVIDKIACVMRGGQDANKYLIALFNYITQGGELLQEVPRELYNQVRAAYKSNSGAYDDWYIGNVGLLASYNGKGFEGGFAKAGYEKTKSGLRYRDYYQEAKRNLEKQSYDLAGIKFICCDYRQTKVGHNAMIYCDPPYADTTSYKTAKEFDYDEFWQTIREWSANNFVLVSEQVAPPDFISIWEQSTLRSLNPTGKSMVTEKLFAYKDGLYMKYKGVNHD